MVSVKGLKVLLLGKEVTMPSGVILGVVTDIKKELAQDKIWMVIDNQGQEDIISIEQIAIVTNKVVLFGDLSPSSLAADGGSYVFSTEKT